MQQRREEQQVRPLHLAGQPGQQRLGLPVVTGPQPLYFYRAWGTCADGSEGDQPAPVCGAVASIAISSGRRTTCGAQPSALPSASTNRSPAGSASARLPWTR